jgi:SAM-dependent methyltransferase
MKIKDLSSERASVLVSLNIGMRGRGGNPLTGQWHLPDRAGALTALSRDAGRMHSIATRHFLIRDGRVRLRSADGVSNELAGHIAAELAPLGLVPDGPAFERLFVDAVLAAHPDPVRAWTMFYDNTMRHLRRPEHAGTGCVATFGRIYRHVLSLIRGTTVLDTGCCFGFLPLLAAERGPGLRVIGTDLIPAAAGLAGRMSRSQGSRARFAAADVLALPVADEAVDTVLAVHVLEHLPAEASGRALAELRRVARCRVVVAVPLEEAPDPTFGHVQAFDLSRLAGIGDVPGWAHGVHAADGGWLVLDRRPA